MTAITLENLPAFEATTEVIAIDLNSRGRSRFTFLSFEPARVITVELELSSGFANLVFEPIEPGFCYELPSSLLNKQPMLPYRT